MSYSVLRVGRQTLMYGGGVVIAKAIAFAMMPVYFKVFDPTDYGVISLVEITFDVLSIIAGSRLAAGIFRFYHKADSTQERMQVLTTALLLVGGLYTAVGSAAFIFADQLGNIVSGGNPGYGPIIRVASLTFMVQGFVFTPMAYLRLMDEAKLYVAADITKLIIQLCFNVLFLVVLETGPIGVFYSNLIGSSLLVLVLGTYLLRRTGLQFSKVAANNLIRFGAPLMLNQVATFFVTFADRYFLARSTSEQQVGLWSVAFQFGVLVASIGYWPYQMIWDPVRYEVAKQPNKDHMLSQGFRHMNMLLITVALGLLLFTGDVVRLMNPDGEYHAAISLVPYVVIAHVLLSWASAQDLGILISERTKYVALANWIAAGVSVAGFATLIPWLGARGAALTCLLSFSVRYIAIYSFAQRLWPVDYDWAPVLRLIGLAGAMWMASIALPTLAILPSIITHACIVVAYLIGMWHIEILKPQERDAVRAALKNPGQFARALITGSA